MDAILLYILDWSGPDGTSETAKALAFADQGTGGNLSGADFIGIILMDILEHPFDALPIPQFFCAGALLKIGDMVPYQKKEL